MQNEFDDLGLAILHALRIPGEPLDREDLAAWAGVTPERIGQIEREALAKVRRVALRVEPEN